MEAESRALPGCGVQVTSSTSRAYQGLLQTSIFSIWWRSQDTTRRRASVLVTSSNRSAVCPSILSNLLRQGRNDARRPIESRNARYPSWRSGYGAGDVPVPDTKKIGRQLTFWRTVDWRQAAPFSSSFCTDSMWRRVCLTDDRSLMAPLGPTPGPV